MLKLLSALSIFALLAGCSTAPISSDSAKPVPNDRLHAFQDPSQGSAVFVVTRDKGFFGSACRTDTSINGIVAAEIGPGETAAFNVEPGRHIVGARPRGACGGGLKEAEFLARENEETRYRISLDSSGTMDISPTAY